MMKQKKCKKSCAGAPAAKTGCFNADARQDVAKSVGHVLCTSEHALNDSALAAYMVRNSTDGWIVTRLVMKFLIYRIESSLSIYYSLSLFLAY